MSCFSNARRPIRKSDLGEVQVRSDDPEAREHDHVLNRQRDNAPFSKKDRCIPCKATALYFKVNNFIVNNMLPFPRSQQQFRNEGERKSRVEAKPSPAEQLATFFGEIMNEVFKRLPRLAGLVLGCIETDG